MIAVILTATGWIPSQEDAVKQLDLALLRPPKTPIAPPVPLTAELKQELVTQMAVAIIEVYQAESNRTPAIPSSQNHRTASATPGDWLPSQPPFTTNDPPCRR